MARASEFVSARGQLVIGKGVPSSRPNEFNGLEGDDDAHLEEVAQSSEFHWLPML